MWFTNKLFFSILLVTNYQDEAIVELQTEESGDDGGVSREAGADHTLDYRLHILVTTFPVIEPVLQRTVACRAEAEDEESYDGRGSHQVLHVSPIATLYSCRNFTCMACSWAYL